jgi:hypothetical protein
MLGAMKPGNMKRTLILLSLLLSTSPALAAETLALLPASGTSVSVEILDSARQILKDHLMATGRYQVIMVPGPATLEEPPAQAAVEQARAAGASRAAVLNIVRLGNSARTRVSIYDVANAQLLHWDSMTTSGGPEDLDPALQRIASGMVTGKPARESAQIDSVTQKEADPYLRQAANKTFGVRVGNLFAFNTAGSNDIASVPGLGVFWMYDARSWLADVSVDFYGRRDYSAFSVSIGGYYPLGRENVTPFVGGSLKWSATNFGGSGDNGVALQPTVGLLVGRLSRTQLRVDLGYFLNLYGERGPDLYPAPAPATYDEHFSHGLMLSAGIGF